MKSKDIEELRKNNSLIDKYVNIANGYSERGKVTFGDDENSDEKRLLDEMFQEKLKNNLKVCATLDKSYSSSSKESSIEDSLKKTLQAYSGFTIEEEGLESTKIYYQDDLKDKININLQTKIVKPTLKPELHDDHTNNRKFEGPDFPDTRQKVPPQPKIITRPINQRDHDINQKLEGNSYPKVSVVTQPQPMRISKPINQEDRIRTQKLEGSSYPKVSVETQSQPQPTRISKPIIQEISKPKPKPVVKDPPFSDVSDVIHPRPKPIKKPNIQEESKFKPKFEKSPFSDLRDVIPPKAPQKVKEKVHVQKREEIKKGHKGSTSTFFSEDIMQKIRFLYHKTNAFEKTMEKRDADYTMDDLQLLHEYANFLNVNYKTQSQIKIIKELEINPTFHDPIEKREIPIWDLMLECGRIYCILAKAYSQLSKRFENLNDYTNAVNCMVNSSKAYKTAAYFSAANTRQDDFGQYLSPNNLELKSEEARIIAQNLALKKNSEDLFLSSKMYSGLAALLSRLNYLQNYQADKEDQMRALINYYKGKSCHLKAKAMICSSNNNEIYDSDDVTNLQKKANYYFLICEAIWENSLKSHTNLTEKRISELKRYLATVNEEIMENDVEVINSNQAEKIQDPEPFIAIPENMSYCVPKFTKFLTNYPTTIIEKQSMDYVDSEQSNKKSEIRNLRDNKAGMGRTLKQIKELYENGDIDIHQFSELYEKYSTKISSIETKIRQLKSIK